MRTSRSISGSFIQGPDENYSKNNFNVSDFLKILVFVGVVAGGLGGVFYVDNKYFSPQEEKTEFKKEIYSTFQKYDKNKDGVLNLEEFTKYYTKNN